MCTAKQISSFYSVIISAYEVKKKLIAAHLKGSLK